MTCASALPAVVPPSDPDLVERIRAGDAAAMEVLMRRHNRILYRTARAILKDDAEAEEAVQDAYLKAFGALERFRAESKLSTWLVRIAANEALMRRRRRARGFNRIRHYGLIANRNKHALLCAARTALAEPEPVRESAAPESVTAFWQRIASLDIARCPHCRRGILGIVTSIAPQSHPPP
jgi:RNA polymerase sigma factor (sigma-70 family)